MKLIDLIVKEVKREDILKYDFFAQDGDLGLHGYQYRPSLVKSIDSHEWEWDHGDTDFIADLSELSSDSASSLIKSSDILAAYDAVEKPGEPEKLVDDDSFGKSERYNRGNIECIDIIREMVSDKSGEEAFCVGNITKYLYRYKSKGGLKDVIKARNYLNQMIKGMEND